MLEKETRPYLIWYHKDDNDGVFSAAIIYNYLLHELHIDKDNIILEGVDYAILSEKYNKYNIENYISKFASIIMTDISFNDINIMKIIYNTLGNSFIWIDHHAPIINESIIHKIDNIQGLRDTSRSAILNAYRFFYDVLDEKYTNKTCPELFRILSAYDSWTYEREKYKFDYVNDINKAVTVFYQLDVEEVLNYVFMLLYNLENMNETKFINKMLKEGKMYNKYNDYRYKEQLRLFGDYNWTVNGEKAVMIYMQEASSSTVFKSLQNTEYKHGIVFKPLVNGNYVISLYNINNNEVFHCGNYLKKKYNGGGHGGAAGATLKKTQLSKILATKKL